MAARVMGSSEGLGAEVYANWMRACPCINNREQLLGQLAATVQACLLACSGTSLLWSFNTVAYCFQEGGGDRRSPLASGECPQGPFPVKLRAFSVLPNLWRKPRLMSPSLSILPLCSL